MESGGGVDLRRAKSIRQRWDETQLSPLPKGEKRETAAPARQEKIRQLACKPGSVWLRFPGTWQPFIWDSVCTLPHATHPDDWPGNRLWPRLRVTRVIPIRSCSRWGLPCRPCCQRRGGLLPHPFTLTSRARRFAFCGTFPEVAPAGRYPAPCFRGARTFLTLPPFGIGKARLPGQLAPRP